MRRGRRVLRAGRRFRGQQEILLTRAQRERIPGSERSSVAGRERP